MLSPDSQGLVVIRLLNAISFHKALQDSPLAGGTTLALRLGHRISIDLDFSTQEPLTLMSCLTSLPSLYTLRNLLSLID